MSHRRIPLLSLAAVLALAAVPATGAVAATPSPTPSASATSTASATASPSATETASPTGEASALETTTAVPSEPAQTAAPSEAPSTASAAAPQRHGLMRAAASPYSVIGAIKDYWLARGGASGWLGSPRSNEMPARGGVYQQFDGGTVYWSSATGAHAVHGAIFGAYAALGYEGSYLGLPVTNETATTGGVYQRFQGGTMYWSATTGSHPVWSGILSLYAAKGYERGSLGMPTTDEYRSSDGRTRQDFTGGSLYWGTTSTTARTLAIGSGTRPDGMGRKRFCGWLRSLSTSTRSFMV